MRDTVRILTAARDTFRACGGAKFVLIDSRGRVCAVGALPSLGAWQDADQTLVTLGILDRIATQEGADLPPYRNPAGKTITSVTNVIDYNNHPDITQCDVEAIFDKAIAAAQEAVG